MKRLLLILLALLLSCSLLSCDGEEAPEQQENEGGAPTNQTGTQQTTGYYDGGSFGEDNCLSWRIYSDGKLEITGNGDMPIFQTAVAGNTDLPWGEYVDASLSITRVVIGEGVTSLSQLSFKNCTKLTSVSLPSTVKEIPYNCFENCTSLLQVSGATSVEVIREDAFLRCPSLKSLTLSPALKTVEYGAFGDYSCKDGLSIYVKGSESDWTAATAQMSVGAQNEAFQNADVRFVAAD